MPPAAEDESLAPPIVRPRVYVDTTIISPLTAWPTKDQETDGYQQLTHDWWKHHRPNDQLCISDLVERECKGGDPVAAQDRFDAIVGMLYLGETDSAVRLAKDLLALKALPKKAAQDANHIAISAVWQVPDLLTWNMRHMANSLMASQIECVCMNHGFTPPIICTPEQWIGEIS